MGNKYKCRNSSNNCNKYNTGNKGNRDNRRNSSKNDKKSNTGKMVHFTVASLNFTTTSLVLHC